MPAYVIPAPPPATVPTATGGLFPVRRIFCVGRNYAEHVREMGNDAREPPFFFTKPADAVLTGGADLLYPPQTASLHHEIELVAALAHGGADIPEAEALTHVWGYAVGLDMTRRDLQDAAKAARRPWDMSKGFDHSAPIGTITPAAATLGTAPDPTRGRIELSVNGTLRQSGDLADMIWSVAETIAHLSRLVRLAPGDLIFTGTPAGVGAVVRHDVLEGRIEGVGEVRARVM